MYRAMYERKYKTTADHLRDEDLVEFIWQSVPSILSLANSLTLSL